MSFEAPVVEYADLAPLLLVLGAAVLGVLVEAFLPRRGRYLVQVGVGLAGLAGALVATVLLAGTRRVVAEGAVVVDGPTLFVWATLLVLSAASLLLFAERRVEGGVLVFAGQAAAPPGTSAERSAAAHRAEHTEVFPLAMFSVGGMMLFASAGDLLTMFVGLEVLSLPLYLLCGLARRRRLLSQESALKYFLLGAFSSAFFVYGIALIYGYAGTVDLAGIDAAVSAQIGNDGLLLAGIGLLAVGLLFKVAAAPFHAWTPDVYQGAPTAVTGFMAACTKIAAFAALLRVFYVGLGGARWDWQPMMWVVAAITMVIGSVVAITQSDIKRMLAYSSIAHAGFILTGFFGAQQTAEVSSTEFTSVQAVLFYLAAYGFTTIGAFAVVTLVRDPGGEATHLSRWAGLGRRQPLLAGVFAFFLLAFAGIPLTSGFTGKVAVFAAAWAGGAQLLVLLAVLMSLVAAFFYVRVIVLMFFSDPPVDAPSVAVPSLLTAGVVVVALAVTVALGVVPDAVLDLAGNAGEFVR